MADDLPELLVADAAAWRAWLQANHETSPGTWLVLTRKGVAGLGYDEALDEALCYGWIDGQARKRDPSSYLQRMTPRRRRSMWSVRNVGIVARLMAQERMQPAGVREVERARADGRWAAAYAGPAKIEVPADLSAALDSRPAARAMFDVLTSQNRYAVLHRVGAAKRPETRSRRIATFVEMLERGETVYPQKRTRDTSGT